MGKKGQRIKAKRRKQRAARKANMERSKTGAVSLENKPAPAQWGFRRAQG
ncbi:hypothetical protein [Lacticaseibacillus absianus]|nr:hypothetical protein [Lacticaseibacillus absianus]